MKRNILMIVFLAASVMTGSAQQNGTWNDWKRLTGTWVGEGSGQPGQGSGTFSFAFDLDSNILVRKSHSEYPATGKTPATVHDDLMVVYRDPSGKPVNAVYFDNEGHTIFYTVSYSGNAITLTSSKLPDVPVFRLIYSFPESGIVKTSFQISQDGNIFKTYIEGNSRRKDN
jgi:hypothetical protein